MDKEEKLPQTGNYRKKNDRYRIIARGRNETKNIL